MSLLPYPQRQARIAERRHQVLRFLRTEIWSTQEVLGQVMGIGSRQMQHKALTALEREDVIQRMPIEVFGKKVMTAWGITAHGQVMAVDVADSEEQPVSAYFEPSRFSPLTAQHHVDIQRLRLRADGAEWRRWMPGSMLGSASRDRKRPDALVESPKGVRVALELERTAKTRKRYVEIMSSALQGIKRSEFDIVHYVCPTAGLAARLERLFRGISSVRVKGQSVPLQQQHYERFAFFEYEEWPPDG